MGNQTSRNYGVRLMMTIDELELMFKPPSSRRVSNASYLRWSLTGDRLMDISYKSMSKTIAQLGTQFSLWGLNQGDRILIASNDDSVIAASFLACLTHGVTALVVDHESKPVEIKGLLSVQEPDAVILDDGLFDSWMIDAEIPCLSVLGQEKKSVVNRLLRRKSKAPNSSKRPGFYETVSALDEYHSDDLSFDPELDAYVLFTSGSTSLPKGVRISRRALAAHAHTLLKQWEYDEHSKILDILPLHHTDGLIQGVLCSWLCGGMCIRSGPFRVDGIVKLLLDPIYRERVTHLVAVPTMLALMLKFSEDEKDAFNHDTFKFVISAAGYLDEQLWADFERAFHVRVCNMYGLTETVTGSCFAGPNDESHVLGTVGLPVDCEVQVIDDNGGLLKPGEPGELLIRGQHLMTGYLNDEQATNEVLINKWLYTGDIATIDESGHISITGRKKNIVISGGLNIQPEEVAEVLRQSPGVVDAVAFGIADETFGEALVACVSADDVRLDIESLYDFCRSRLTNYKIPKQILQLPSLPYGPSGKVLIESVHELYNNAQSSNSVQADGDLKDTVYQIAAQAFHKPVEQLSEQDAPGTTYGWDSFAHLAFISVIESSFRIRIPTKEIIGIQCLGDAVRAVGKLLDD